MQFEKINLLGAMPFFEKFDVIFCRNVLFYFKEEDQIKVQEKLLKQLKNGGYLVLGNSDKLLITDGLEDVGITVYKKK
ncbi:hypothetical protein BGC07_03070 [Piscirickettsia litoralis]|uniref:CheR-type methyltransferase domain-containing protein n=1 Tax=Piscirickettsia litoralis TaxID=1891921 RepID=A0ABX3A0G8_9GAMM|nr:hypothetical protein BGC07_03070 [Piscirickettsia litoralis]